MSVINFPSGAAYCPTTCSLALRGNVRLARSEETGDVQTAELPGARWLLSASWPARYRSEMGTIESVFAQLNGRVNRIALWHFGRPEPAGMTGAVAVFNNESQGDSQIIVTAPLGGTFLPGEMIGVLGQLLMVTACTGSGNLVVDFEPRLRFDVPADTPVTYVRPTANFILTSESQTLSYEPGFGSSFSASFEEVF